MALADFAQYRAEVAAPYQTLVNTVGSTATSLSGAWYSTWRAGPDAGAIPTTAAVPTRALAGTLGQQNASGVQRVSRARVKAQNQCSVVLADRLSHQGGLSGTVTTPQTTNLPTAALTRYATGDGVWIGLEIYTQVGATQTTVTASYTNSAGVAGRTTQPALFGGTDYREAQRVILLPLQQGDVGVQSVQSVTVLATTGTAGNFGVTLFRMLDMYPCPAGNVELNQYDAVLQRGAYMPEIVTDAALWYCVVASASTTGVINIELRTLEE